MDTHLPYTVHSLCGQHVETNTRHGVSCLESRSRMSSKYANIGSQLQCGRIPLTMSSALYATRSTFYSTARRRTPSSAVRPVRAAVTHGPPTVSPCRHLTVCCYVPPIPHHSISHTTPVEWPCWLIIPTCKHAHMHLMVTASMRIGCSGIRPPLLWLTLEATGRQLYTAPYQVPVSRNNVTAGRAYNGSRLCRFI
ncbi:hypothetical protein FKP32DRAFT_1351368 [Trametes sanguinea]|nr:hypothetical protein FKP32DRAFT_1351368 [Trametes sanguinea]